MSRKFLSNSTEIPNDLFDEVLKSCTGNEVKCFIAIARLTICEPKPLQPITNAQLQKMTGITDKRTVRRLIASLIKRGFIKRYMVFGSSFSGSRTGYRLVLDDEGGE